MFTDPVVMLETAIHRQHSLITTSEVERVSELEQKTPLTILNNKTDYKYDLSTRPNIFIYIKPDRIFNESLCLEL